MKMPGQPAYSRSDQSGRRCQSANRRSANRLAISVGLVTAVWLTAVSRWIFRDAVVPWDSKNQFYAFFRFLSATLRAGEWPFWNLYHYGGHPSVADPQSLVFSPVFVAWGLLDPVPTMRAFELDDSESLPRANARNESGAEGFVPAGAISMLMTKEPRTAIRTPRGWAISVLHDAAAIRECEYHGSMQDRADPHARDRAVDMARQDPPPPGVSPDAERGAGSLGFNRRHLPRVPARLTGHRRKTAATRDLYQRPRRFSTRLRVLPTFLTASFTADADRPVFFDS
jgi:hypothetical protein